LETPRKKTDAHVHVRYFVLVGHNLNIDYVVVKNKPDFIFGQKKESKTYKSRSLLRRGGLSRHEAVAYFADLSLDSFFVSSKNRSKSLFRLANSF
jgi:hypothetical protein